jgi:hypothetical protein
MVSQTAEGYGVQLKLESLAARPESQQAGAGTGVAAFAWRGNTCVVAAERVRISLAQAQELCKQVRVPALPPS